MAAHSSAEKTWQFCYFPVDNLGFVLPNTVINGMHMIWSESITRSINGSEFCEFAIRSDVLDPAMLRPGRVDFHVKFTNATREEAKTLFMAMYTVKGGTAAPNLGDITRAELDMLADEFKSSLNDEQFSPAQMQGFLLTYKSDPRLAVRKIKEWIATEDSKR
ncbi:hypothetical protein F5Y02DRAFT_425838 [Annulohypoxylon stygium]|nr:hypothetical protein F5Y02DRAFT_425838 [Annulohypoxylon stygium]